MTALEPLPPRFEDGFVADWCPLPAPPPWGGEAAPAPLPSRERGGGRGRRSDQGDRPCSPLRGVHRRGPCQLRGAARRDLRPAGSERRRQIHHLSHAVRPAAPLGRRGARRRCRPAARTRRSARAHRLHGAAFLALRRTVRAGEPAVLRPRLWPWSRRAVTRDRRGTHRLRPDRDRHQRCRRAAPRPEAAPCARRRIAARARHPVPRRAHIRRRSADPPRLLGAHRHAGGHWRHRHGHQPLHGRSGILRPARHRQPRKTCRGRYAGRIARACANPSAPRTHAGRRVHSAGADAHDRKPASTAWAGAEGDQADPARSIGDPDRVPHADRAAGGERLRHLARRQRDEAGRGDRGAGRERARTAAGDRRLALSVGATRAQHTRRRDGDDRRSRARHAGVARRLLPARQPHRVLAGTGAARGQRAPTPTPRVYWKAMSPARCRSG